MPTSRTAPGGAAAPGVSPPGAPAIRGRRAHAGPPGPGDHRVPHTAARRPAGDRWRPRPRTVRARIISLLMVPVVSLLALWGFATVTTAQDVTRLRDARHVDDRVRQPVAAAAAALQAERSAAVRQAAAPGTGHATGLQRLARRTDAAVGTLRLDDRHTVADTGDLPADVAARVRRFVDRAEGLAALRTAVIDGGAGGDTVYARYTAAISAAFDVQGALTGMPDVPQGSRARVLLELARAGEMLSREDALLTSDPAELGDLFRLDHLTTRMRRHAESLIILSGAAPGRAWRTPVPLTDVVRAAVSEIEDYARVEVRHLPETAVDGTAVADLTHLLAELVENATQFSPPHTKVRVTGEPVGNGYALEIEDRGLGMGRQALAEANHRIRQSEALDLFDSDRLGLFVVSRLSARHDIQVHLRPSPYGGTTAVVLLPTDLLRTALPADVAGRATTVPVPPSAAHSRPPQVPVPTPTGTAPADHQPHEPPPARVTALPVPGRPPGPPSRPSPPRPGRPDDPVVDGAGGRSGEHDARNPTEHGRNGEHDIPSRADHGRNGEHDIPSRADHGRSGEHDVSSRAGRGPHDPRGDMVDDRGGLPRRVRQASLAPQLREAPPPRTEPDPATGDNDTARTADPTGTPLTTRTPEQVRDRMTAYRDGWVRGGAADEGDRR
ncbi:sensor histidine kinase [Streptomyces sp. NPDC013953]|uniref:sensor histidine kinase n=1 Tax=Streptomyces sp. NPDC013953 TaxID=3364868 RepID=UPI0036FC2042